MRHILYHANCADGFLASCIAQLYLTAQGDDIRLLPISYEDKIQFPKDVAPGDSVLYLDYSPPAEVLAAVDSRNILVIDHHRSAQEMHTPGAGQLWQSIFSTDHSGAALAFNFFHPEGPLPEPVRLLNHYDLGGCWTDPRHPDTMAALFLHNYLMRVLPRQQTAWNEVLQNWTTWKRHALDIGAKLWSADQHIIQAAVKHPSWVVIGGYEVPALTGLPHGMINDALHALLEQHKDAAFAAAWNVLPESKGGGIKWSLRGQKGRGVADLGALCAELDPARDDYPGGGGHPQAAGFSCETPVLFV